VAKLTAKQQMFVSEYLVDLNATQAAIRAGYSTKMAGKIGYQLLEKTRIQEAIETAMKEREKRTQITADRVLQELARIAYSDMRRFSRWGPGGVKLKNSEELSDDEAACVAEVSETVTEYGGSIKFKLHDKLKALELAGRHLGLFKDKLELSGETGVRIINDIPRDKS